MSTATAQRPKLRLTMPQPTETDCRNAIRDALRWHPAVAWIERLNRGIAWRKSKRTDRFGRQTEVDVPVQFNSIKGGSDLIGQLKASYGGRFLAIEAKRPSTRNGATAEQRAFLAQVRDAGGVAFVAAAADEALAELEAQL